MTDCTGASKDDIAIVGVVYVAKSQLWVVNGVMDGGGGVGIGVVLTIGEESMDEDVEESKSCQDSVCDGRLLRIWFEKEIYFSKILTYLERYIFEVMRS